MKTPILFLLSIVLHLTSMRLGAAAPTVVLTDPDGIGPFELYGSGLYWWSGPGVCGTEHPRDATIRLRGTINGATKFLAQDCTIMPGNVVRDDAYAYFFINRQLMRKALNASLADPAQVLATAGFNPTLPANQRGPVLLLAEGRLYWSRYSTSGLSDFYWMPPDGSEAPHYLLPILAGDEVAKMELTSFTDSGQTINSLVILFDNGRLYRYKFNASGTLNQIATGVSSFAIQRNIVPLFSSSATIYAAVGVGSLVVSPDSPPGKLLRIDASTGSSTTVYNSLDNNQVLSVATDSDIRLTSSGTKNVYIAEGIISCGDLFCTVADVVIKRHALPASTSGWEQIVSAGGGGNLRSDDDFLYFRFNNSIKKISTDAPAQVLDLKADALEVVQAIQDLNSSVTLVANRPTYVRGYAHILANTTGFDTWFPGAKLRGFKNGTELTGSPIEPINSPKIDSTSDLGTLRSDLTHCFLFELPENWVKPVNPLVDVLTFEMTVNADLGVPETPTNPLANNPVNSAAAGMAAKGSPRLVTVPLLVAYAPTYYANDPSWPMLLERTRSLLPVEDFSVFTYAVTEAVGDPDEPFKIGNSDKDVHDEAQSDALDCLEDLAMESDPFDDKDEHYFGLVHPSNPDFNGVSRRDSEVLIARMETDRLSGITFGGGKSAAHEIGHDYGRRHVQCGNFPPDQADFDFTAFPCSLGFPTPSLPIATFGFDYIEFRAINPTTAADLMSYAGNRWISQFTWDALLGLTPNSSSTAAFLAEAPASDSPRLAGAPVGQVLLVRGRVDEAQQIGFFRTFCALPETAASAARLAASRTLARRLATQPNQYMLRQINAAGAVLLDTPVAVREGSDHEHHLRWSTFQQYIDFQPLARTLQLVHLGKVLAERFVSARLPVLTLGQPVFDASTQTLFINWAATDADGDSLRFSIQYSADNGLHWRTLRSEWKALELSVSTRMLPGSSQARLRVLATDGVNCALATTGAFNIPRHAPELQIGGVAEGQRVPLGTALRLRGFALDAENPSHSNRLVWSLTGPHSLSSTGSLLTLRDLSPGSYTAILTAMDGDGQSASTNLHFEVQALVIPNGPTPSLDGLVNDRGYAEGALVRMPLGNGEFAPVHLVHAGGNLFVSFRGLKYTRGVNRRVGLRVDPNASRDALGKTNDIGFFIDEDGIPSQETGTGSGMNVTLSPKLGFSAVIFRGSNSWSAELRIAESLLGGWNHLAGLMLDHDAPHWPPLATDGAPVSWAPVYFGTNPPASTNRAPVANAGVDQRFPLRTARNLYLDGTASHDPDGSTLTFSWRQISGPAVTLVTSNSATPHFLASPVTTPTALLFELRVNDGTVSSAADQVQLTLLPALSIPVLAPPSGFATLRSDGKLQMRLIGTPRQSYRIESSEDFVGWNTVRTVFADFSGRIDVTELVDFSARPKLFFRAVAP